MDILSAVLLGVACIGVACIGVACKGSAALYATMMAPEKEKCRVNFVS
jgi:hypothetical protein